MIFQIKAKVIRNTKVKDKYYKLILNCSQIAKIAKPGQFVNIKISDDYEPLLRRPFGIRRVKDSSIEILYEVVGKATEILSRKKPGEHLDVLGPLGNGFELDGKTEKLKNGRTVLVAGGMGVAPLIFLAEKLVHSPQSTVHREILVLLGARTKNRVLCANEFKKLGCEVKISTDDGSAGFRGRVTDLLKKILVARRTSHVARQNIKTRGTWYVIPETTIYACGPHSMLKEVAKIANRFKIRAYGSLEEHMACGIGACLGCVVKTKSGYQTVCKDGPVFDLSQIEF